jgi:hypothetical protein
MPAVKMAVGDHDDKVGVHAPEPKATAARFPFVDKASFPFGVDLVVEHRQIMTGHIVKKYLIFASRRKALLDARSMGVIVEH